MGLPVWHPGNAKMCQQIFTDNKSTSNVVTQKKIEKQDPSKRVINNLPVCLGITINHPKTSQNKLSAKQHLQNLEKCEFAKTCFQYSICIMACYRWCIHHKHVKNVLKRAAWSLACNAESCSVPCLKRETFCNSVDWEFNFNLVGEPPNDRCCFSACISL